MHEKLADALHYIRDSFIADAAGGQRKRRRPLWLAAAAAVLVLVVLLNTLGGPMTIQAKAVSLASGSRVGARPDVDDYKDQDEWRRDYDLWKTRQEARSATVEAVMTDCGFLTDSSRVFLSGAGQENRVWSPVNGYIALAMLAETTAGETQAELLALLGAADLKTLRDRVGAVWESTYRDNGKEIRTLANSLWVDEALEYDQTAMDSLAYYHYASVYQGDLSSAKIGKARAAWLNENTGGLLRDFVGEDPLPEGTLLALASTVYFQAKWSNPFRKSANTQGIFHGPGGDQACTYMNKKEAQMNYYWGENFGAVSLGLKNGSSMWLILPDEGKTVEDVLAQGAYNQLFQPGSEFAETNSKYMKVNLSMPKFDVQSGMDLRAGLQQMGVTRVFDPEGADFSGITGRRPLYITAVNQAARVMADEEGVKAASYIEMPGAGAAMPPEEIIDFILDRPFLFVITANSLPLFTGVVNSPDA